MIKLSGQVIYLGEESPPVPVSKFQVSTAVSLDNTNCNHLVTALLEMPEYYTKISDEELRSLNSWTGLTFFTIYHTNK